MTERLDEIRKRLEAATPGPWCYENVGDKCNDYVVGTAWKDADCDEQISGRIDTRGDDDFYREAICFCEDGTLSAGGSLHDNAALIAHAPEDIAYLLKEVERLEVEKAELIQHWTQPRRRQTLTLP